MDSIADEQRRQLLAALSSNAVRDARAALDAGDPDTALAIIREQGLIVDRYMSGGPRRDDANAEH